ncbi:MAG TPA: phosphate/phosphite/phosphonate ABC transporter substrate-binding protein, partial [Kofleriaceae bacterium]|nr:phosphate/phosphite/phosphonate ABC transporter substrate-binding protein [Kofleriaceae bacterium]
LYELATGRRPFPGQNYNETLANILTREPPPARQVAPDLPPALEALLERCLDPDPDRRHRSAGELRRALADLRPALAAAPPPRKGHRRRWLLAAGVAAAAGLFLIRGPAPEVAGAGLRVTWSPYQDRAYLAESTRWLLDELTARTGQSVHFAPATSYDDCIGKLVAGQVDAAGLSPASYALATARDPGLVLLARIQSNGADTYQAILVTRASSPLRAVGDARGRSFCFVDPSSTAGFVYPRAMLRSAGIDPDRDLGRIVYAGNHQRLIALLAEGGCDVAGSSTSALTQWAEEAGLSPASFRILAASDPIPGDALVARSDLPPDLLARLRAATAGLIAETAGGRFPRDREISGLVAATDGDYDRVRVLVAGKR